MHETHIFLVSVNVRNENIELATSLDLAETTPEDLLYLNLQCY